MRTLSTLVIVSLLAAAATAQGPDVIVGSLSDVGNYGSSGGIYAYSLGTVSCNIGNVPLNWVASTNDHPVIAQNIYRLKNGRFEQIGMSWLKHGFTALTGSICATCNNPGTGSLLGIGCSDPYSSSLNGSQSNGPRNEVNASTGVFPYPIAGSYPPGNTTVIGRRIQCQANDVNPAMNAGATYYAEGQYVAKDDAAAGNKNNNASYRAITFAATTFTGTLFGGTFQQQPAIMAWPAADPTVVTETVDWPGDGRFIIAKKVTNVGGGTYHYEFAVHNLNSHRSGRGFTVTFPAGTVISNAGFKDIPYHSGEPYSGTDWSVTINGDSINWATDLYAVNPNANALRWSTLYNFWCDATAPSESSKEIEPFRCPADPVVPSINGYVLDTNAAFDDPAISGINGPSGDNISMAVPIGFSFNFYGTNYTTAYVTTNGLIAFSPNASTPPGATQSANYCIPASSIPNGIIAGYWDNLTATTGQIRYQTIGTAPNRRFVVWWNNVPLQNNPASLQNFKVILDETSNVITSTILSSAGGGLAATRGIERQDGFAGITVSCNTAGSVTANTSWTCTPVTQILPSADLTVSGDPTANGVLTWSINSNANGAPVIIIASTDPGPTSLDAYGTLNLGFTPGAFAIIADGTGVLQPANPSDLTDSGCGLFSTSIPVGPVGLPLGLTIHNQGIVLSPSSVPAPPNGLFHLTDLEILNT
jgi:hypothetical protein